MNLFALFKKKKKFNTCKIKFRLLLDKLKNLRNSFCLFPFLFSLLKYNFVFCFHFIMFFPFSFINTLSFPYKNFLVIIVVNIFYYL